MASLKKFAFGVVAGVAGAAYVRSIKRRNDALVRPKIRNSSGAPLPVKRFEYSDGEEIEYVDVGTGDVLVWIPGADGPKETFQYQLPRFAQSYRVICADLREAFPIGANFDRFVEDLKELLNDLEIKRAVLIGQSLGSAIAIRFATLFPERMHGLVLCNPLAKISYDHVGFNRTILTPLAMLTTRYLPTGVSRRMARFWSRLGLWVFDDSSGREALINYALFTGPRTVPASVSGRRVEHLKGLDLRPALSDIKVPALVVKGPCDVYCPVSWAIEITDALPDAKYILIPKTGHCSHISRPGAFNQALEAWLCDLSDRSHTPFEAQTLRTEDDPNRKGSSHGDGG
jgi:pimeloyl-ACP methyl ester carboxylesterase